MEAVIVLYQINNINIYIFPCLEFTYDMGKCLEFKFIWFG